MRANQAKADPKALSFLLNLRALAKTEQITATEAVRQAIVQCPRATRIGVKHAAMIAGINARTARNTYDRVTKA